MYCYKCGKDTHVTKNCDLDWEKGIKECINTPRQGVEPYITGVKPQCSWFAMTAASKTRQFQKLWIEGKLTEYLNLYKKTLDIATHLKRDGKYPHDWETIFHNHVLQTFPNMSLENFEMLELNLDDKMDEYFEEFFTGYSSESSLITSRHRLNFPRSTKRGFYDALDNLHKDYYGKFLIGYRRMEAFLIVPINDGKWLLLDSHRSDTGTGVFTTKDDIWNFILLDDRLSYSLFYWVNGQSFDNPIKQVPNKYMIDIPSNDGISNAK